MDFFFVSYFINNQLFVLKEQMFVGDAFTVFHSTAPDTHPRVGGEFPDNSVFKGRNLLSIK